MGHNIQHRRRFSRVSQRPAPGRIVETHPPRCRHCLLRKSCPTPARSPSALVPIQRYPSSVAHRREHLERTLSRSSGRRPVRSIPGPSHVGNPGLECGLRSTDSQAATSNLASQGLEAAARALCSAISPGRSTMYATSSDELPRMTEPPRTPKPGPSSKSTPTLHNRRNLGTASGDVGVKSIRAPCPL